MQLKLGLIGIGTSRSRAPQLHRVAGEIGGVEVSYELVQPDSSDPDAFEAALSHCRAEGYRGVNVTFPFKERAAQVVHVSGDEVRRLGAVNTIRFDEAADPQGFNTDYTGFRRAFRSHFAERTPGVTALVGAGGVGRAIAFGLVDLGATEVRLYDQSRQRAAAVAAALGTPDRTRIEVCDTLAEAASGADGLINATQHGMYQYPHSAIPKTLLPGRAWAFDAVYTPMQTEFLRDAIAAGLEILYGYELFFYQGVDAFELFTGVPVDAARLRAALDADRPT